MREPWTSAQLWSRAEGLAAAIEGRGLSVGDRVVWTGGRSPEFVAVLLACLTRGAVFVPVARALPEVARERLLGRVAPSLVLGSAGDVEALLAERERPAGDPIAPIDDGEPAYIAFTSGSSGVPKGVVVPRRGLAPLAHAQARAFRVTSKSRTSFGLAAHFDAAISDVLVPLVAGATLVILPEPEPAVGLIELAHRGRLTHVDLPPSLVSAFIAHGIPGGLQCLVVGGEVAPRGRLRELSASGLRVVNVYGPTEATVCSSIEVVTPASTSEASIGAPIPGTTFHIDKESGELRIGGSGIALGYLDDPAETAARFPTGPDGSRRYRTGDRVERAPDGTFLFKGRLDRQVQVHGVRIEPEEIERVVAECQGVDTAAVLTAEGTGVLQCAFEGSADAHTINSHLETRLEPWKRPAQLHAIDPLPRLSSGKVDFETLRTVIGRHPGGFGPGGASSGALAEAWCRVLGVAHVRDGDTFEDHGGDSVRALELMVEAARLGVAVEADALGSARSFGALRRMLTMGAERGSLERAAEDECEGLSQLRPTGGRGAVLVTGAAGFLGAHVAHRLQRTGRDVVGLVRARNGDHALSRLESAGLTGPGIQAVAGDVRRRDLGLTELDALTGVTDIVHCAGHVSLTASTDDLRGSNVTGTVQALRLAARLGARVHHVSTLSVFAEAELARDVEILRDGAALELSLRVHGGYAASKWIADAVVARVAGPGWTLRPGLLVGAPLVEDAPRIDQLSRVCRGLAELGSFPEARLGDRFDCTPVEAAARATVRALETECPGRTALHIAREQPSSGADLVDALRRAGVKLDIAREWPPRSSAGPISVDAAVALAATTACQGDGRLPRSGDLFLASELAFEAERARDLEGTGALADAAGAAELDRLVCGALAGGHR